MPRRNYSFAEIKRRQSFLESLEVTETLSQEMIELANLLAQETKHDFDFYFTLIENICKEILPGHQGVAKLIVFRAVIRDRLMDEFIGYEESVDHSETISDARNLGNP